ncbi:flagellar export protein FliJ [Helicobacter cappadocius]|uniref:Flagellar export protein FliJ n=1 Tax=Helicobacter cappadocius TaxID=3063998 RepID=A0AA90T960_9HELI|nr:MULTISPECIES: flagellar export protein FliJ [unclassified Helicobacter]MDO7252655.1 flagellar export protein FliJ [Helicobacter sp. faydin-H75]MDP2538522.1 flagellar export protein FliJ [Helicobacter sp. faydin-H76]
MNTKFDSLLKIKQQQLDKCEIDIMQNNQLIDSKNRKIDILLQDLSEVNIPKNGGYWDFKNMQDIKKAFVNEIDKTKNEISRLKNIGKKLQESYKIAFVEYEKIKYLKDNEIKKMILKIKKNELKDLDEVGIMLFKSNKENV